MLFSEQSSQFSSPPNEISCYELHYMYTIHAMLVRFVTSFLKGIFL